ncbi:Rieske (2Fe-2S) protein [Chitinibacteraceae bacterium HSL-7]
MAAGFPGVSDPLVAAGAAICASDRLEEGGLGMRFAVQLASGPAPAFVIRHHGEVHAYLNRCAHIPVELDYNPGDFFDLSRQYIVCATHGAYYSPVTGRCLGGPCPGRALPKLAVSERDGQVWLESMIND